MRGEFEAKSGEMQRSVQSLSFLETEMGCLDNSLSFLDSGHELDTKKQSMERVVSCEKRGRPKKTIAEK